MVYHDLQVFVICQCDELLGLSDRRCEWFFNKNVFPILEGIFRKVEVGKDGSNDGNGIDLRRGYEFANLRSKLNVGISLFRMLQPVWPCIAY
jgi:hypothetical protein